MDKNKIIQDYKDVTANQTHRIGELLGENQALLETIRELRQEIRVMKAHPSETVKRVIIEHKPMPKPIRGDVRWLGPDGGIVRRETPILVYPTTKIWFTPSMIGIDAQLLHMQHGLEINWEV